MTFIDRKDAGKKLAKLLLQYKGRPDVIVIAIPRGGVIIGRVIADELHVPLDIVVPRKIGAPENKEFAIGAITEIGETVWNETEQRKYDPKVLEPIMQHESEESKRRLLLYRQGMPPRDLKGMTVILADDGIATGLTMMAAIATVKAAGAQKVIVAIPGGAGDSIEKLKNITDEVYVAFIPTVFLAVGQLYEEFQQVKDEEVMRLLHGNIS